MGRAAIIWELRMIDEKNLCELVAVSLEVEPEQVTMESTSDDFPEWDSLGHLTILMELKEALGDTYEESQAVATAVTMKGLMTAIKASAS